MPTDPPYQLELADFSMNDKTRFMRIAIPPEGHPFYVTILGRDPEVTVTAVWPRAMVDQLRNALNAAADAPC